tara:strand:- start:720 stop:1952 length:1233 start_codon:yes stop_codon:yes gene_type:complete
MTRKINSGYEGEYAEDFVIPEANIEDMDRSLFELFDKTLGFQIKVNDQAKKVPVVFSTGERFALTRRKSPIRDRNNTLILPIISIHRTSFDTSPGQSGYGTPISFRDQQSYTIRKKLSSKDRDYQKIINKLGIKNQDNVASRRNFSEKDVFPGNVAKSGKVASRRNGRNLTFIDDKSGYLLRDGIGNNIFEIITLPYPTFFTSTYEITFWTQYMSQMNQLIETMLSLTQGQDYGFKMTSKSGYEYVAYIKSPFNSADNFSDFSSDERIIKYTFNMMVPGYLLAIDHIGMPSPFRRFYSAPQIEFGYSQSSTQVVKRAVSPDGESIGTSEKDSGQNKHILSDVEQEDKDNSGPGTRGMGDVELVNVIQNPFTGEKEIEMVKVLTRNQRSGETVASSIIIKDLETTLDTADD